jgi:hypothetical protein
LSVVPQYIAKNNIENYKLGHSQLFGQQIYGMYIIMPSDAVEIKSYNI